MFLKNTRNFSLGRNGCWEPIKAIIKVSFYFLQEPLPPVPLSGMLNKHGGKVRLTFKPEQDQLWLGTKERTEKLAMTSIKSEFNSTKST